MNDIIIKGAKQNNLKNIDLTLPREKLIVFTGLSGSGKSSLAFDTIFAEGQRRQARRGEYRRIKSRDKHRPENDVAESAFDGGNGDGNIRLPETSVCEDRNTALSAMR